MATVTRSRREVTAKPRNDAYTGLLFISFLALVISSILLFLDYSQYDGTKPPKVSLPAPGASTPTQVQPAGDANPAPAPMGDAAPMNPMGAAPTTPPG
jgi:hypothetical protein